MKNYFALLSILGCLLMALPLQAQEQGTATTDVAAVNPAMSTAPQSANTIPLFLDEELAKQHKAFKSFARTKISALNRNHRFSRSRMAVSKNEDGNYTARYHSIVPESMVCQVRRSKSKTVPYVGVLHYQEHIFEATGPSPAAARQAEFTPVKVIPNQHIFCYKNGWK